MTKKLEKAIKEYLFSNCDYNKKSKIFEVELYADYRDDVDDSCLKIIFQDDNPYEKLLSMLNEGYQEEVWRTEDQLVDQVSEYLDDLGIEYDSEELSTFISENVSVDIPLDHYLDQKVCVNIVLDVGDANYEFVTNSIYPSYYGESGAPLSQPSSLVWVAKQQGYTKTDMKNALYHNNTSSSFLKSVRRELLNTTTAINAVHIMVRMSLRECLNLNQIIYHRDGGKYEYYPEDRPKCGYIVIDKDSTVGLVDNWNGAGGLLGIQLEKDLKLPIKYIYSAEPDCCKDYSVKSIYGCNESEWSDGGMKELSVPKKLHNLLI